MKRFDARRFPKRPTSVPRASTRRAQAPAYPLTVERFLAGQLLVLAKRFTSRVRKIVLPKIADFAKPEPERMDARGGDLQSKKAAALLGGQMRKAAEDVFSKKALRNLTDQAARRVEAHSKDQFRKIGIDPKKEPDLKWLINGWSRDIAERVKGITTEQITKLQTILSEGGARHAETIARDIEEQLGVTENRANFIARDSIGTLNSQVTRYRLEAAKIRYYVWTSMRDDRVREKHEELDGEVFDVDGEGDPEEGHPGEPPNCRCVQWPLPADEEEEAA